MSLQQAKALFVDLIENVPPERWDERLAELANGDEELRRQVGQILAAHRDSGSFLDAPAATLSAVPLPAAESPGTVIGPYKLLEQIGEGGFGVVYMAEQTRPVRRHVAFKALKPGMDSRQVVARFEAERQALAIMDHPNIAKVFDGGLTPAGRPYFVMELVKGIPITEFCDRNSLTTKERLELFISTCQAVQHAHQKGVIHRDLKPSNVLVTVHDTTPVPKVIDFGVAKALGQELTEKTLFTGFAQMIGTPLYMSPEQAGQSGLDIDTRSDIYSLGVLLYELLTGTTPFARDRFKTAAFEEIRRIIHEEEPPKPSTRLMASSDTLPAICAQRRTDPEKLAKSVRGELDWIVMKALEKDRSRRYATANSLAEDVRRFLSDEPVEACPPSSWYRSRKFVARHTGAVAAVCTAIVVVLLALAGLITSNRLISRETHNTEAALEDARHAEQDARERLFQALIARARSERSSGRVGQRFEALKAIRQAAAIRITPELKAEAAAALVLPDMDIDRQWEAIPAGTELLAFDAQCRRYARLDQEGGIAICRYSDGGEQKIANLPTHGKHVFKGLRMSPDGQFVAVGHSGKPGDLHGELRVWKLESQPPAVLLDQTEVVFQTIAFPAESQFMAYARTDGSVRVVDLTNGNELLNLPTGDQVRGLVFHPHDRRLAVACGAAVRLFDSATGLELSRLEFPGSEEGVNSVAWRPDGRVLAAGCDDRKIHLLDVEAQKEYSSPLMHADYGLKVAFDRTGERLFSTGTDGRTLVWDATNGRLELRTSRVMQIHASADNRWFAFDTRDGLVRLWTLTSGKELRIMRPLNAGADANYLVSALHRDGRVLAASSYRRLHFFDLETGQQLAEMSFTDGRNASILGCDPTGAWLTGGTSGLLKWPVQTREDDPETLQIGPPQILARGFNSDASWGAGVSSDGRLIAVPDFSYCTVIEQGREAPLFRLGEQTDMRACAISDDWVITCSHWSNGTTSGAQVWSARDGAHVRYLPLKAYVQAKFSPDGKWLATSSPEEGGAPVTRLWDTNNWRERLKFESRSIAFSPDSRVLAVADERGAIRLVDMHSGREFGWLNAPEAQSVVLAGFTPDASKLIAANAKWEILVWDLRAVRSQLKAEGLDWEWPDQPPRTPPPLLKAIEVVTGDLGAARLSPDEQAARDIETYRQRHAANPAGALQCNNLAWAYVMAPEPMREVARAVELAETAVRGQPNEPMFVNTLGASYYRANRFAEAIAVLRPNLEKQADDGLAFDLFFLAMSCQRLGDVERAHDYYRWAMRWMRSRPNESAPYNAELAQLKTETEKLLENSGK